MLKSGPPVHIRMVISAPSHNTQVPDIGPHPGYPVSRVISSAGGCLRHCQFGVESPNVHIPVLDALVRVFVFVTTRFVCLLISFRRSSAKADCLQPCPAPTAGSFGWLCFAPSKLVKSEISWLQLHSPAQWQVAPLSAAI